MSNFSSKATGDWDSESLTTWNEAGHPTGGDTVTIQNGHTVTLDSATACTTLTIDTGGVLTDATNNQGLTVSGLTSVTGTLTCGSGAMSFGSTVATTTYSILINSGGVFVGGSGTHTVGSFGGGTGSNVTYTSGVMTLNGENTSAGAVQILSNEMTFDDGDGTITCTYTGDDTIFDTGSETMYNLIINAAGTIYTLRDSGIIDNDLTITAGTFDADTEDLTVTGVTNISGTLSCGSGTVSLGSTIAGTMAIVVNSSGAFIGDTATITSGAFYFTSNSDATMTSGTHTVNGTGLQVVLYNVYIADNCNFDANGGTLTIEDVVGSSAYLRGGDQTLNNLIIDYDSQQTSLFQNSIVVGGDLTITSGGLTTNNTGNESISVTGTFSNAGTLTCNASTITLSGDLINTGTIDAETSTFVLDGTTQSLTGSVTFWSFTKSVGAADTLTFDNTATYTFGGNVTLNGGVGQLLSILSDSAGDAFNFTMSAGAVKTSLTYLSVKDSDASGSDATQKPIAPTSSTDVSGNTDWFGDAKGSTMKIINNYYY